MFQHKLRASLEVHSVEYWLSRNMYTPLGVCIIVVVVLFCLVNCLKTKTSYMGLPIPPPPPPPQKKKTVPLFICFLKEVLLCIYFAGTMYIGWWRVYSKWNHNSRPHSVSSIYLRHPWLPSKDPSTVITTRTINIISI